MADEKHPTEQARKAFKLCNVERNKLKGIVIGSLEELRERSRALFGLDSSQLRVFLEEDGTEIEDNEYLRSLPEQSKLLVTNDDWAANQEVPVLQRSTTFSPSLESNESLEINDDVDSATPVSEFLLKQIKRNPLYFVSFSDDQLQSIIDCDASFLAQGLNMSQHETRFYQETCQRELDKRLEMHKASELLKLYDKGMKAQADGPGSKKQRT